MHGPAIKIFYADDDIDDIELLREGLSNIGSTHVVSSVSRGDDVLQAVNQEKPDIIILDYNLPALDGASCLELLKLNDETSQIPVVMYSTSSAPQAVQRCYDLGAARYILKPVSYSGIFKGLELLVYLYRAGELTRPDREKFLIDTYRLP